LFGPKRPKLVPGIRVVTTGESPGFYPGRLIQVPQGEHGRLLELHRIHGAKVQFDNEDYGILYVPIDVVAPLGETAAAKTSESLAPGQLAWVKDHGLAGPWFLLPGNLRRVPDLFTDLEKSKPLTVREVGEWVTLELGCSPYDVNDGRCEEWAGIVADRFGGESDSMYLVGHEDLEPNSDLLGHIWLVKDGRHYDAECLDGVADWHDLPIFSGKPCPETTKKSAHSWFLSHDPLGRGDGVVIWWYGRIVGGQLELERGGSLEEAKLYLMEQGIDGEDVDGAAALSAKTQEPVEVDAGGFAPWRPIPGQAEKASWVPPTFKVGDQVRLRIAWEADMPGADPVIRGPLPVGTRGRVLEVLGGEAYIVGFDSGHRDVALFADEIEPVPPDTLFDRLEKTKPLTVREAGEQVIRELGCSPRDISDGRCVDWAQRVEDLVGGEAQFIKPDLWPPAEEYEAEHAWLLKDGHYYDAECLDGVADWHDLPIFSGKPCPEVTEKSAPSWFLSHDPLGRGDGKPIWWYGRIVGDQLELERGGSLEEAKVYLMEQGVDGEDVDGAAALSAKAQEPVEIDAGGFTIWRPIPGGDVEKDYRFKVGDRVRTTVDIGRIPRGTESLIERVGALGDVYWLDFLGRFTFAALSVNEDQIELVGTSLFDRLEKATRFRIGDRVSLLAPQTISWRRDTQLPAGSKGTVTADRDAEGEAIGYYVLFDAILTAGDIWVFDDEVAPQSLFDRLEKTGEMGYIDPVTGEEPDGTVWNIHAAIARALGGTIHPFDQYQGPYVQIGDIMLFVSADEGGDCIVIGYGLDREMTGKSDPFFCEDEDAAVRAAESLGPFPGHNPPTLFDRLEKGINARSPRWGVKDGLGFEKLAIVLLPSHPTESDVLSMIAGYGGPSVGEIVIDDPSATVYIENEDGSMAYVLRRLDEGSTAAEEWRGWTGKKQPNLFDRLEKAVKFESGDRVWLIRDVSVIAEDLKSHDLRSGLRGTVTGGFPWDGYTDFGDKGPSFWVAFDGGVVAPVMAHALTKTHPGSEMFDRLEKGWRDRSHFDAVAEEIMAESGDYLGDYWDETAWEESGRSFPGKADRPYPYPDFEFQIHSRMTGGSEGGDDYIADLFGTDPLTGQQELLASIHWKSYQSQFEINDWEITEQGGRDLTLNPPTLFDRLEKADEIWTGDRVRLIDDEDIFEDGSIVMPGGSLGTVVTWDTGFPLVAFDRTPKLTTEGDPVLAGPYPVRPENLVVIESPRGLFDRLEKSSRNNFSTWKIDDEHFEWSVDNEQVIVTTGGPESWHLAARALESLGFPDRLVEAALAAADWDRDRTIEAEWLDDLRAWALRDDWGNDRGLFDTNGNMIADGLDYYKKPNLFDTLEKSINPGLISESYGAPIVWWDHERFEVMHRGLVEAHHDEDAAMLDLQRSWSSEATTAIRHALALARQNPTAVYTVGARGPGWDAVYLGDASDEGGRSLFDRLEKVAGSREEMVGARFRLKRDDDLMDDPQAPRVMPSGTIVRVVEVDEDNPPFVRVEVEKLGPVRDLTSQELDWDTDLTWAIDADLLEPLDANRGLFDRLEKQYGHSAPLVQQSYTAPVLWWDGAVWQIIMRGKQKAYTTEEARAALSRGRTPAVVRRIEETLQRQDKDLVYTFRQRGSTWRSTWIGRLAELNLGDTRLFTDLEKNGWWTGRNTKIRTEAGKTIVRLHSTDIVAFDAQTITLNTGGWRTITTSARMNEASSHYGLGYRVGSDRGEWIIGYGGREWIYPGREAVLDRATQAVVGAELRPPRRPYKPRPPKPWYTDEPGGEPESPSEPEPPPEAEADLFDFEKQDYSEYAVVWDYDEDADLSFLEQWDTPQKYAGNEVIDEKTGLPMPFDEYMQTYGNPDRHVMLWARVLEYLEDGNIEWKDSVGGVDFMDWQEYKVGEFTPEEAIALEGYQGEVSKDLLTESGWTPSGPEPTLFDRLEKADLQAGDRVTLTEDGVFWNFRHDSAYGVEAGTSGEVVGGTHGVFGEPRDSAEVHFDGRDYSLVVPVEFLRGGGEPTLFDRLEKAQSARSVQLLYYAVRRPFYRAYGLVDPWKPPSGSNIAWEIGDTADPVAELTAKGIQQEIANKLKAIADEAHFASADFSNGRWTVVLSPYKRRQYRPGLPLFDTLEKGLFNVGDDVWMKNDNLLVDDAGSLFRLNKGAHGVVRGARVDGHAWDWYAVAFDDAPREAVTSVRGVELANRNPRADQTLFDTLEKADDPDVAAEGEFWWSEGDFLWIEPPRPGAAPSYPAGGWVTKPTVVEAIDAGLSGSLDVYDVKTSKGHVESVYGFQVTRFAQGFEPNLFDTLEKADRAEADATLFWENDEFYLTADTPLTYGVRGPEKQVRAALQREHMPESEIAATLTAAKSREGYVYLYRDADGALRAEEKLRRAGLFDTLEKNEIYQRPPENEVWVRYFRSPELWQLLDSECGRFEEDENPQDCTPEEMPTGDLYGDLNSRDIPAEWVDRLVGEARFNPGRWVKLRQVSEGQFEIVGQTLFDRLEKANDLNSEGVSLAIDASNKSPVVWFLGGKFYVVWLEHLQVFLEDEAEGAKGLMTEHDFWSGPNAILAAEKAVRTAQSNPGSAYTTRRDGQTWMVTEIAQVTKPPSLFDRLEKAALKVGDVVHVVESSDGTPFSLFGTDGNYSVYPGDQGTIVALLTTSNPISRDAVVRFERYPDKELYIFEDLLTLPTSMFDRLEKAAFKVGDYVEIIADFIFDLRGERGVVIGVSDNEIAVRLHSRNRSDDLWHVRPSVLRRIPDPLSLFDTLEKAYEINFEDDEAIRYEFLREYAVKSDEVEVDDNTQGLSRAGNVKGVKIGDTHVIVFPDEAEAERIAVELVDNDLRNEPENFNQEWLSFYIDEDNLRDQLMSDAVSMNEDSASEEARDPEEFWKRAERFGMAVPDDTETEPDGDQITEFAEKMAEQQLEDPVEYLKDIYPKEELMKEAIRIAGINYAEAAQAAINEDGWVHFMSSYDGESHETANGLVYFQDESGDLPEKRGPQTLFDTLEKAEKPGDDGYIFYGKSTDRFEVLIRDGSAEGDREAGARLDAEAFLLRHGMLQADITDALDDAMRHTPGVLHLFWDRDGYLKYRPREGRGPRHLFDTLEKSEVPA
jgi:hypothetical protein